MRVETLRSYNEENANYLVRVSYNEENDNESGRGSALWRPMSEGGAGPHRLHVDRVEWVRVGLELMSER